MHKINGGATLLYVAASRKYCAVPSAYTSFEDAARPYGNGIFMRMLGWGRARKRGPTHLAARRQKHFMPSLAVTMTRALTADRTGACAIEPTGNAKRSIELSLSQRLACLTRLLWCL